MSQPIDQQSWNGMWTDPAHDPRDNESSATGEKAVVAEYLDRYRQTLPMKCEGLDAEQLARRSVPPSTMSLLGMVRHLASVEHHWFRRVIEGHDELDWLISDGFEEAVADEAMVADAWANWQREVDHARTVLAGVEMGDLVDFRGQHLEVRDLIVHMLEEYARHMGHVDLLRECIDGRTGQ